MTPEQIAEMEAKYGSIKPGPSTSLLSALARSNPRVGQAMHSTRGLVNAIIPGIALDYNFTPDLYNPFTTSGREFEPSQDAKTAEGLTTAGLVAASGGLKQGLQKAIQTGVKGQSAATELLFKNKAWEQLPDMLKNNPDFLTQAAEAYRKMNLGKTIPKSLGLPNQAAESLFPNAVDLTKKAAGKVGNMIPGYSTLSEAGGLLKSLAGAYLDNPLKAQAAPATAAALGNIPVEAWKQTAEPVVAQPQQPTQAAPSSNPIPVFAAHQQPGNAAPATTMLPTGEAGVSQPQPPQDYLALAKQLMPELFAGQQASSPVNYQPGTTQPVPPSPQIAVAAPVASPNGDTVATSDYTPPREHMLTQIGMLLSNMSRGLQGQELDFYGPARQLEQIRAARAQREGAQLNNQAGRINNQSLGQRNAADLVGRYIQNVGQAQDVANAPDRNALVNEQLRLQNTAMSRALTPLEQQRLELLKMFISNNLAKDQMSFANTLQPTTAQKFASQNPGVFDSAALEKLLNLQPGTINSELLKRTLRPDMMAALQNLNLGSFNTQ